MIASEARGDGAPLIVGESITRQGRFQRIDYMAFILRYTILPVFINDKLAQGIRWHLGLLRLPHRAFCEKTDYSPQKLESVMVLRPKPSSWMALSRVDIESTDRLAKVLLAKHFPANMSRPTSKLPSNSSPCGMISLS
jgi:hypothetical protein